MDSWNPKIFGARFGLLILLSTSATLCLANAEVTLVDGRVVPAEVLFEHPNAPVLVVRSQQHRTVQSLPKAIIQKYSKAGQSKTLNPPRKLNALEERELQRNTLWADEAGPGQLGKYATETWEPKPLLVWARPGESGDGLDYANWLDETGKPLTVDPWVRTRPTDRHGRPQPEQGTFDGDILLPASDSPYRVLQSGNRDHLGAFTLRHLTVERNADYNVRYTITGNLWMKDGSEIGGGTQTGGMGSGDANKHTFARFCNWHEVPFEPKWAFAPYVSHWVRVDTGESGSLEIIGYSGGPSDRITFGRGTLIVSTDSSFLCGNRAAFYTAPGTTLILLDGAMIGSPQAIQGGSAGKTMGTYGIGGTILFGHPEKPLTRDLEFSACRYRMDSLDLGARPSDRASGASWIFGPQSRAVVHSSDPTRFRVRFVSRGPDMPLQSGPKDLLRRDGPSKRWLAPDPAIWKHPDMPPGVIALFAGETEFDGVHFDNFYEGGILVSPEARARWRNVTFGSNNLADPEKLFAPLAAP